jgi:hypothetical protein
MNNRGEQLEKHEILKATMLEVLKNDSKLSYAFNLIWEACSDMERYVQYGFSVKQRDGVFMPSNWNVLNCNNLDEISDVVFEEEAQEKLNEELSIQQIVNHKGLFEINSNHITEAPERFTSVINFSNFLLHVLRIQTEEDISLDDKRLIDFFDIYLKPSLPEEDRKEFVKKFGFSLLKVKHIFDQFIIKREFIREKDHWSLKKLKWYKGNKVSYVNTFEESESLNKEILMLLSMYHVSTPTFVYKHWLNAALYHLFYCNEIDGKIYKEYLLNLAEAYLFDRYIATEAIDYYEIIYKNKGLSKNKESKNYDLKLLDKGTDVENFIFNYLDYILWKENVDGSEKFEYTSRSSVEHFYPQHPISKDHAISPAIYDLFGNLCLISSSKNSRLSNHMPMAKKDYYYKVGIDSLKQNIMMSETNWTELEINLQGDLMKDRLEKFR